MKTAWDYTELAETYEKRPDYAPEAIDTILALAGLGAGARACDIGAGSAHLTLPLLDRGLIVDAVEPNDAMRAVGQRRTAGRKGVTWHEGTGEATGQAGSVFDLACFGSSFNVCDRLRALAEARRILKPGGWFACLWNHRDLDDPLQRRVEDIIRAEIPDYDYGSRREDQTEIIKASGLFHDPVARSFRVKHKVAAADWIAAWRSHGTLARQAADKTERIVKAIEGEVTKTAGNMVEIGYITPIWVARARG